MTFDKFCYSKCCIYRREEYLPPLEAFLDEWECLEIPAQKEAKGMSKRKGVFLPLAKQSGLYLVSRLAIFKAVTAR